MINLANLWRIMSIKYIKSLQIVVRSLTLNKRTVSCKTRNHPQTSQTIRKPPTNQPNYPQISHKSAKPPTNHPQTSQTTHKPVKYRTNHPQTSQLWAENQFIYVTKNFSNTTKHVLNLQPFYSISLTFSGEDQNQVGIEEEWCEII